ncbi:hypothetical protein Agub_g9766, partial [Astrephomene gubernaculifera]
MFSAIRQRRYAPSLADTLVLMYLLKVLAIIAVCVQVGAGRLPSLVRESGLHGRERSLLQAANASAVVVVGESSGVYPWGLIFPDAGAKWIWSCSYEESFFTSDMYYIFTKVFTIDTTRNVSLYLVADNRCDVYLDGELKGPLHGGWPTTWPGPVAPGEYILEPGVHTLDIQAVNLGCRGCWNPAGVIATLIDDESGEVLVHTDESWTWTYNGTEGDLRLVTSEGPVSDSQQGMVQIYFQGRWVSLHQDSWGFMEARAACRQLGWGTGIPVTAAGALYGSRPEAVYRSYGWYCDRTKDRLTDCGAFSGAVYAESGSGVNETAGVECRNDPPANDGDLRLLSSAPNATLSGAGILQIYFADTWAYLSSWADWGYLDARAACRQLGWQTGAALAEAGALYGSGSNGSVAVVGPVLRLYPYCSWADTRLANCSHGWNAYEMEVADGRGYNQTAGVECRNEPPGEGQLRLVGSDRAGSGTLLLYHSGAWGALSASASTSWDWRAARLVCQQLGWRDGSPVADAGSRWGSASGRLWRVGLSCEWGSGSLVDCPRSYDFEDLGLIPSDYSDLAGVECTNETEAIRLVHGSDDATSSGRGTLQLLHRGTWGALQHDDWDWRDARVACRQLGWTNGYAVLESGSKYGIPPAGPVYRVGYRCLWSEVGLAECERQAGFDVAQSDSAGFTALAGLECTNEPDGPEGGLRLTGGPTAASGTVEIWYNGSWGSIHQASSWDWRAARVACRQLGYQNGKPVFNAVYGRSRGPVWLSSVSCGGGEAGLVECGRPPFADSYNGGSHEGDAGVECTNDPDPEVGSVRLAGGAAANTGQVEVFYGGSWGAVCAVGFGIVEASVVCRQLGYQGTSRLEPLPPGRQHPAWSNWQLAPVWLADPRCGGGESRLLDCPGAGQPGQQWGCSSGGVGVTCGSDSLPPEGSLRLISPEGNSSSRGQLQVLHNGIWGVIDHTGFDWHAARVACRELGFTSGRPAAYSVYGGGQDMPFWLSRLRCSGAESRLVDCPRDTPFLSYAYVYPGNEGHTAGVICSADPAPAPGTARLVEGPGPWAGRLEVWSELEGAWGTVCNNGFNDQAARVVCRQLGYMGGRVVGIGAFTPGATSEIGELSQPFSLSSVVCSGQEGRLADCGYVEGSSQAPCGWDHTGDVAVWCDTSATGSEPALGAVRLVGGPGPWSGRVEVYYNGTWGAMCNLELTDLDAQVICRQLGYYGGRRAPPISLQSSYGYETRGSVPMWLRYPACNGSEAVLTQCSGVGLGEGSGWDHDSCGRVHYWFDAAVMCNQVPQGMAVDMPLDAPSQDPEKLGSPWPSRLYCPEHSLPGGLALLVDSPPYENGGDWADSAGVLGIRLYCYQDGTLLTTVTSDPLPPWSSGTASWGPESSCTSDPAMPYITAARIRVAGDEGGAAGDAMDSLGVTDVELRCSNSNIISGNGLSNGTWGEWASCPQGTALCGLGLQVNSWRGWGLQGTNDDTAVTGLNMSCCFMPQGFNSDPGSRRVRLAGGSSPREGRVEMLSSNNTWGLVYGEGWDARDAHVVCRELGWETGRPVGRAGELYGEGFAPLLYTGVDCKGTESSLADCSVGEWLAFADSYSHSSLAGVICSADPPPNVGTARLVDIQGVQSPLTGVAGRVEVYWNYTWGAVSMGGTGSTWDSTWDNKAASVVCRSLGHRWGRAVPARDLVPEPGYPLPVVAANLDCTGDEASLLLCSTESGFQTSYDAYSHSNDAGAICSDDPVPAPGSLRLRYGATPAEGRLEVFLNLTWDRVPSSSWQYGWQWPYNFDHVDARVACRQLGYRGGGWAVNAAGWGGSYEGPVWLSDLTCAGNETSLLGCLSSSNGNSWSQHWWWPGATGVICTQENPPADGTLRLVGSSPSAGRLEVAVGGMWGTVDPTDWGWAESLVACRALGYKSVLDLAAGAGEAVHPGIITSYYLPVLLSGISCNGSEASLAECYDGTTYGPPVGQAYGQPMDRPRVLLRCSHQAPPQQLSVRLTGSPVPYMGRLEVWWAGAWGTVSRQTTSGGSAAFGPVEAAVACRMLGYEPLYGNTSDVLRGESFGEAYSQVPIHYQQFACSGTETSLWDCPGFEGPMGHTQLGPGSSSEAYLHNYDVGLACQPPPSDPVQYSPPPRPPPIPPSPPKPSPPSPPPANPPPSPSPPSSPFTPPHPSPAPPSPHAPPSPPPWPPSPLP